jgi:hypothetical protein
MQAAFDPIADDLSAVNDVCRRRDTPIWNPEASLRDRHAWKRHPLADGSRRRTLSGRREKKRVSEPWCQESERDEIAAEETISDRDSRGSLLTDGPQTFSRGRRHSTR